MNISSTTGIESDLRVLFIHYSIIKLNIKNSTRKIKKKKIDFALDSLIC